MFQKWKFRNFGIGGNQNKRSVCFSFPSKCSKRHSGTKLIVFYNEHYIQVV